MCGLQVLDEITENILKNPNDPKYRRLKITSEKMKQHIMPLKGTVEFLQKVCFYLRSFASFLISRCITIADKDGIP